MSYVGHQVPIWIDLIEEQGGKQFRLTRAKQCFQTYFTFDQFGDNFKTMITNYERDCAHWLGRKKREILTLHLYIKDSLGFDFETLWYCSEKKPIGPFREIDGRDILVPHTTHVNGVQLAPFGFMENSLGDIIMLQGKTYFDILPKDIIFYLFVRFLNTKEQGNQFN